MRITLHPVTDLSDDERTALGKLNAAVYPPEVVANWPGRAIEWVPRQTCVIVWKDGTNLAVAHAGIVVRDAKYHGRDVKIGGIGGVMTHPKHRTQGCATAAIGRCLEYFQELGDIDFGLLVCVPELISLYAGMGWREFPGELLVRQQGQPVLFTFNRTMTHPIRHQEDLSGVIDLLGSPW